MTVGQHINQFRIRENMTLVQFAGKANISKDTLNSWIYRGVHPDIDALISIADAFGVSLDELVGRNYDKR